MYAAKVDLGGQLFFVQRPLNASPTTPVNIPRETRRILPNHHQPTYNYSHLYPHTNALSLLSPTQNTHTENPMASRPGPSTFRPVAGAQQQQQQQQRPIPPTANTYPRTTPGGIQARGTPALQRGVFGAQNTQRGPTIHRGPLQNVDPPAVELTEEQRGEMVEAVCIFK